MKFLLLHFTALLLFVQGGAAAAPASVFLEDLTTAEVSAAIRDGHTTIIIPVGGVEQNGPHMALGKHNVRVKVLAGRIGQQLGNAIVAPVVAYVPEGNIAPPTEHMRFAGTISVPEAAFKSILEGAARGFRQHGFRDIVLLGDHGGYQNALKAVATSLNRDWTKSMSGAGPPQGAKAPMGGSAVHAVTSVGATTRAHFVGEYYRATQTTYVDALKAKGLSDAQIGIHAASADTSLLMAIDPTLVKPELFAQAAREGRTGGTVGDPRPSSAALGQLGVDAVVRQTVAAIASAVTAPR